MYEKTPILFFKTKKTLDHKEAINYICKHSDQIEQKLELIGTEFIIHGYKKMDILFRKDNRLILIEVKNKGSISFGKRQLLSYKSLLERFKPLFIKNYKFEFIVFKCCKHGLRGYKFFDENFIMKSKTKIVPFL